MSLRRLTFLAVLSAAAAFACGDAEKDDRADLTQREKDSILGASRIPGARAVKKTLTTSDSAAARQARLDSAMKEP